MDLVWGRTVGFVAAWRFWWLSRLVFVAVVWGLDANAAKTSEASRARPNILWITCEDTGPQLGCYGDAYATTPNLDALASKGLRYHRVWSTAPVCAPARTAIITGLYPSAAGSEAMRSQVPMPAGTRMFPQWLRDAGYYCVNNVKEDYNVDKPGRVWDESSAKAHWRNRPVGRPFFAVFNFTETHESQTRAKGHVPVHDPAAAPVPPYMPSTPEARAGWAQYYDKVSEVDRKAGALLRELERDGLADDTIVFFFGDHGPGLPRSKRSACDSGLRVPFIVFVPERWRGLAPEDYRPGGVSRRLVGFVDLGPTVLSLAGIRPPKEMHGVPVAGEFRGPAVGYLFGHRSRMDERMDLVRSVTDGRYVYVRNFMPHLPHGQRVAYLFETPMTVAWKRLEEAGELPKIQTAYWERRAPEELYDLESDPFETVNLAHSREHRRVLERMRRRLDRHTLRFGDAGLLPEAEMIRRAGGGSPGDLAEVREPDRLRPILRVAQEAANFDTGAIPRLREWTRHSEGAIRYWAALGILIRGRESVLAARADLERLLEDESASVRVVAAEAMAAYGEPGRYEVGVRRLLRLADPGSGGYLVAVAALNALDRLPASRRPGADVVGALPTEFAGVSPRMNDYLRRLHAHLGVEPKQAAARP